MTDKELRELAAAFEKARDEDELEMDFSRIRSETGDNPFYLLRVYIYTRQTTKRHAFFTLMRQAFGGD